MKSTNDPTEIFGKTESEEGYFILHNFWPVFKFHQILGLFPCKKVSNELGQTQLQPMKTWVSILLFFTWMLFLIVPPVGTQMYFEMKLAPIISNTTYKTDVRPNIPIIITYRTVISKGGGGLGSTYQPPLHFLPDQLTRGADYGIMPITLQGRQ